MLISDISGRWYDNQIPLCKWLDTGSQDVEFKLKSNKENQIVGIVLFMSCVDQVIPGVVYTSRYQWASRHALESDACRNVTREFKQLSHARVDNYFSAND